MPHPPDPPAELLAKVGTPETVFGPNPRFRRRSLLVGCALLVLAAGFLLYALSVRRGLVAPNGVDGVALLLATGLVAVGGAAVSLSLSARYDWVYICPRGLIRSRGVHWDAVTWADVARVEAADITGGSVTARQCRLTTATGEEWGFIADWVADFDGLVAALQERTRDQRATGEPSSR